ncbi:MAG: hypothetical protein ACKO37_04460 [Vampirovibrionales bacterium]
MVRMHPLVHRPTFLVSSCVSEKSHAVSRAVRRFGIAPTLSSNMGVNVPTKPSFSTLFWIANGLTYVPAAILTPWMTNKQLKNDPNISERERHLLVHQEISRQTIGALIHCINYYPAVLTTQALQWLGEKTPALRRVGTFLKHEHHQAWSNLALVTLMNTLGYGLLRPGVVNYTLQKTLKHPPHAPQETTPSTTEAPLTPSTHGYLSVSPFRFNAKEATYSASLASQKLSTQTPWLSEATPATSGLGSPQGQTLSPQGVTLFSGVPQAV